MRKVETRLAGYINVDSGNCWVGDPCYILHTDQTQLGLGNDWGDFCKLLEDREYFECNNQSIEFYLGCMCSTGFGDGRYPVYVEIEDHGDWGKRVRRLIVDFIPPEDTDDDYDSDMGED